MAFGALGQQQGLLPESLLDYGLKQWHPGEILGFRDSVFGHHTNHLLVQGLLDLRVPG